MSIVNDWAHSESSSEEGFGSLTPELRILAIERLLTASSRHSSRLRADPAQVVIDAYYEPDTSVARFNAVFPLGRAFHRWKDGIRLFVSTKSSRCIPDRRADPISTRLVTALLQAGIVERSRNGPFVSNIFYVAKDVHSVRPIINYAHLSPFFQTPALFLPSLFQVARKQSWSADLHYVKLDFRQAFFVTMYSIT